MRRPLANGARSGPAAIPTGIVIALVRAEAVSAPGSDVLVDDRKEVVRTARLGQDQRASRRPGSRRNIRDGLSCEGDDGSVPRAGPLPELPDHLDSIHPRHRDVGDDKVEWMDRGGFETSSAIDGRPYPAAGPRENEREHLSGILVVLDDKDRPAYLTAAVRLTH